MLGNCAAIWVSLNSAQLFHYEGGTEITTANHGFDSAGDELVSHFLQIFEIVVYVRQNGNFHGFVR
jgi:hypothetical protein